jgi:Protein of unknown function (DUF998)
MMDTPRSSRREATDLTVPAARLALAAAVVTPVLIAGLRFLSAEFDPSYRMISEYALGRYGWVLSLTFLAWGISSWALAVSIRPRIRTRGGRVGLAFLVVAGLGEALASVFDIRHNVMHNLAGALGILGLPVAALLLSSSLRRDPEWSCARRILLVLANLTWASVVLLVAAFVVMTATFLYAYGSLPAQAPRALPPGVIGLVGWADRLLVVVYCAWVAAAARALRLATRLGPPAGAGGR